MKCSDPYLVRRGPSGNRRFLQFSLADYIWKVSHDEVFSCGKCLFCRKSRARELAVRCVLHASCYRDNCFLTLTYDEKKEGYHNVFEYPDIQGFKKRLRQHVNTTEYCHIRTRRVTRRRVPKWLYKKVEVFNVHEYGRNGKKHWHLVVFGFDFRDKVVHTMSDQHPLYTSEELSSLWRYGFSTIGTVTEASAMYQAQYMEKDFKNFNNASLRKSHSRHSGIGRAFFLRHYKQILSLGFIPFSGRKYPVFRYFEKLAKKHWCHFYEPEAFLDFPERKKLFSPFKAGEANREIADLWNGYVALKESKVNEMKEVWDEFMIGHLESGSVPDFQKSGSNALYDLRNSKKFERF